MNEENIITTVGAQITEDKRGHYSSNNNDFVGTNEITVTITLHEYRELVKAKAESDRDEMQSKLWKEQDKTRELQKQIDALKTLLPCQKSEQEEVE